MKQLIPFTILCVSLFFLVFSPLNKSSELDDEILNPYFSFEQEKMIFNEKMLGDLSIIFSGRASWLGYYSSPMLLILTDFSKNIYKYIPSESFKIVSYDSLYSGIVDTLAKAMFKQKNSQITSAYIEMKNMEKVRCEYKYGEDGFTSICKDNYSVVMVDENLVCSDSFETKLIKKGDTLEGIESFYCKGRENPLRKWKYELEKNIGKASRMTLEKNDSVCAIFFVEYCSDGKIKEVYSKGVLFSNQIVKNNCDEKLTGVVQKNGSRERQMFFYDSSNVDAIRYSIVNFYTGNFKDSISVTKRTNLDLINSSRKSSLARVEYQKNGNQETRLFLSNELDTLGMIKLRNSVVDEIVISLKNEVYAQERDGFRKIRFLKDSLNKLID